MIPSARVMDGTLAMLQAGDADCCRRFLELGVRGGWISEEERAAWLPRIAAWERFLDGSGLPVE